MGKASPQQKLNAGITAALIGAAVALLIAIAPGIYFLGVVNEKINNLTSRLSDIEKNNAVLSSGLTLTNNILTRVLNHGPFKSEVQHLSSIESHDGIPQ